MHLNKYSGRMEPDEEDFNDKHGLIMVVAVAVLLVIFFIMKCF